jgi:hypothetical protein
MHKYNQLECDQNTMVIVEYKDFEMYCIQLAQLLQEVQTLQKQSTENKMCPPFFNTCVHKVFTPMNIQHVTHKIRSGTRDLQAK